MSDNEIPFSESLENKPGVLFSLVIGFWDIELFVEHAEIKIKINANRTFLVINYPFWYYDNLLSVFHNTSNN